MNFLLNYGFLEEEIKEFTENVPPLLLENIFNSYMLVSKNIDSLKAMGIKNYKNIFMYFYDMFLMDNSNFMNIFNKYDMTDLVEKIENNFEIVEFL